MANTKDLDLAPYARCDLCSREGWQHYSSCPLLKEESLEDLRFSKFIRNQAVYEAKQRRGLFGRIWDRVYRLINDRKNQDEQV